MIESLDVRLRKLNEAGKRLEKSGLFEEKKQ